MNTTPGKLFAAFALFAMVWTGIALMTGTKRVLANTFTVTNLDDSGEGSLRQAILDANTNAGPDDINFQDELTGTITLTTGELLITDDLTINGPGIRHITVSGNHASRVFEIESGVTATISGLTIADGKVTNPIDGGAGIKNRGGVLTITNIMLLGNVAGPTGSGVGGGILNGVNSTLVITNSTLSRNSADAGGGIHNNASLAINNCAFQGNSATFNGGGILNNGGSLSISNSTLSSNSASSLGGGIVNWANGAANISFATLFGNSASNGGGIFNDYSDTLNIKNSIVAASTSGGDCSNAGTWNATGTNFTTNGTCPGFTQVTAAQLNLGPLADNGGPTQTHALLPGSVAIDAAPDCTDLGGNPSRPTKLAPADVVTTDQRGVSRPQGKACDVGSYEFMPCNVQPTITCPENISVSTDPDQCSAVVQFNPEADCPCAGGGTAKPSGDQIQSCMKICSPPSGSAFPKGTTTVTCTASDSFGNTSEPCSFTITVSDTQPPTIACPANVTAVTPIPGGSSAVVTFPPPTAADNCAGVTTACNPPSGSTFAIGCTVVTCTATDTSGNTASCTFTLCLFNVCLQDDSNANNILIFNTTTGDYRFCCNGITFSGKGKVNIQGSTFTLEHNTLDRRVRASVTGSAHTGNASLQSPPGKLRCNITDSNTTNNTNCSTCQ
jgi:hypothetical protein